MDIKAFLRDNFVRFLALVCLFIGLADAGQLLGISGGSANPILVMGTPAFILLSVFTLARLFAAVGLWLNASWGGVLLIGATVIELILAFSRSAHVSLSLNEMSVRLALLIAISVFLILRFLSAREHAHD